MNPPTPLRTATARLKGFPVTCTLSPFGPAPLHVTGKHGSALAHLSIYVHEADIPALVQELPGHLQAPPVWTAWLACHAPLPLEWTWGYQQARRLTLPRGGVFLPRARLELDLHCQHPAPAVLQARLHGMLSYLVYVPAQDLLAPTLNAAD